MNIINRIKNLNDEENYYLLLAMVFCLALRLFTPQMIGFGGGDTIESWDMARRLLFNEEYYIIHRTARFGTIIPIYITQVLFGTNPLVYYIAPAIASLIQTFFLFKIALLIRGKVFAFITTIVYLSFPQMIREFSHPRVSVFATMFFLISFYYALKFYTESTSEEKGKNPRIADLLVSGLNIFFMYMAKEDSLYFLPAIMLIVYLSRKKFTDVILLGILPFSLFIAETLVYHFFTEFSYGRLSVITGEHFDSVPPLPGWLSLFDRFRGKNLRPYFRYPLILSIIAGLYFIVKRYDENGKIKPIFFVAVALIIYLVLLTFLVKSIHPVIPLNTFRTRYMNIVIPLMLIIIVYAVFELLAFYYKKTAKITVPSFLSGNLKKIIFMFMLVYTFITVLVFFAVYKKEAYRGTSYSFCEIHPFPLLFSYNKIITDSYYSGRAFAMLGVREKRERYEELVNTIDTWIKSGMPSEQACKKYGISVDDYYKYKNRYQETVTYDAETYPERVFLYHGRSVSGLDTFEYTINGENLKFFYNRYLTCREEIIKNLAGGYEYPLITFPPFHVSIKN